MVSEDKYSKNNYLCQEYGCDEKYHKRLDKNIKMYKFVRSNIIFLLNRIEGISESRQKHLTYLSAAKLAVVYQPYFNVPLIIILK